MEELLNKLFMFNGQLYVQMVQMEQQIKKLTEENKSLQDKLNNKA
jgi:cell division protein FtsB